MSVFCLHAYFNLFRLYKVSIKKTWSTILDHIYEPNLFFHFSQRKCHMYLQLRTNSTRENQSQNRPSLRKSERQAKGVAYHKTKDTRGKNPILLLKNTTPEYPQQCISLCGAGAAREAIETSTDFSSGSFSAPRRGPSSVSSVLSSVCRLLINREIRESGKRE